ncbi:DUF2218 domain-containing protein [Phenylobacterium sp.]|uniref:DUF2218 domain-containing protein n=1 Tax=Phenylobacterium sp. TaxID=1871053 RepID=UPI00272F2BB4|nr:DUF2218 domain-containing protein [Phenylobacterium sp.]MDP1617539.1 DUF2218 domain-containing protein [Phenylobacterium sp.]MDP1986659.1 DUF2218 domain-containing protein [Phenylobacterium sp.]
MLTATASVATAHAHRYMVQLCKHFGHKVTAEFDETSGRIAFPMGETRLAVAPEALELSAQANTPEDLARLEEVIASHLKRFAFREPDLAVAWRPEA